MYCYEISREPDVNKDNGQEPVEEDHGGGQDPHRVVAPIKRKKYIKYASISDNGQCRRKHWCNVVLYCDRSYLNTMQFLRLKISLFTGKMPFNSVFTWELCM
jgi:hypothetical protein